MVTRGYGAVAIAPTSGGSEEPTSGLRDAFATLGLSCGIMSFTGLVFLVRLSCSRPGPPAHELPRSLTNRAPLHSLLRAAHLVV